MLASENKHTYYNFCKCADDFLKSKKKYLSDNLPAGTMISLDRTFLDTYDNSIPRYNFRVIPIYTAWKCYTFLFQDVHTKILEPNHEDFQCHASAFNRSALLLGLAYDCKLLHNKSNQSLEQIFKTFGSRNTPNEEYSDNWFLHTPMKEEYDATSVLDLYVNFLDIEK